MLARFRQEAAAGRPAIRIRRLGVDHLRAAPRAADPPPRLVTEPARRPVLRLRTRVGLRQHRRRNRRRVLCPAPERTEYRGGGQRRRASTSPVRQRREAQGLSPWQGRGEPLETPTPSSLPWSSTAFASRRVPSRSRNFPRRPSTRSHSGRRRRFNRSSPGDAKPDLRVQLDTLGFNEVSIYRDLDRIATRIKNGHGRGTA